MLTAAVGSAKLLYKRQGEPMSSSTAPRAARIVLDHEYAIAPISPLLFGGFAEHMGRCIYEGMYDPHSQLADERGYRRDVLEALRALNLRVIRYPGGNFLSGYNWLDGVGPREQRPRRRDMAWYSIETNQFGTHEFIDYCRELGTDPMLAVNLGTGTIQGAGDLVEYCNAPTGTYYADLRAAHGSRDPFKVHYWCIGNEMDGPWQIGHLEADEYGRKAREAAKIMKWHDPSIALVLCGSSSTNLATYPAWDRVVLEHCWEHVDYLSLHYYANNYANDTPSYLALARQFEDHLDTLAGTLQYVKTLRRSKHDVFLSWDEWNVWYKAREMNGRWTEAPHLIEEVYNLEDALVVAQWMNVFLRRCDVLRIACLAQIVNVIAPILTRPDGLLLQSIYFPFQLFSTYASGQSLRALVDAPTYTTAVYGEVPLLDVSASYDADSRRGALFVVNRSQSDSLRTEIIWRGEAPAAVREIQRVSGSDPKAANSFENPHVIGLKRMDGMALEDGKVAVDLPPLSFTVLTFE
jgi:alpha-N-arabinofuranosidase